MVYIIRTAYRSCTLKIPVTTTSMCNVFVIVTDYENGRTILTKKVKVLPGGVNTEIGVQMTHTGKNIIVEVFENEFDRGGKPVNFTIGKLYLAGLPTRPDILRDCGRYIDEWILFRGQFAFNAKWLATNKSDQVYQSNQGHFKIRYVPMIIDEDGKEDVTPMNRNKFTGIISVSQKKLFDMEMTVPGIITGLDHEYSHIDVNKDPEMEVEADLNGCKISLSTGISPYEAKEFYYTVIYNVESEENFERLHFVDDFIDKFEQLAA